MANTKRRFSTMSPRSQMSIDHAKSGQMKMLHRKSILINQLVDVASENYTNIEREETLTWRDMVCCRPKLTQNYTMDELDNSIVKLHKYCLTHLNDTYRVHICRMKGIELLEEIIIRTNVDNLRLDHIVRLVWSSISCVHHFHVRLKYFSGSCDWNRKRQLKKALNTYDKLIKLLMPYYYGTVIEWTITFYTEAQLWNTEYLCSELLKRLFVASENTDDAVEAVLDVIEKSTVDDIKNARQIVRVLYEVLEFFPWPDMNDTLMVRLLNMFRRSITPEEDDEYNYAPLHKGLEVCVRHVMENLTDDDLKKVIKQMLLWVFEEDICKEALLDFGNVLEYAALLYDTKLYSDCLPPDMFPLVLKMIASENELHSLLGNRVFQHLFDRRNNRLQFDTPRIFFEDTHFNVDVGEYHSKDKLFISNYREIIHASLLASIEQHGMHRINMESTYTSIALIVVEVPCGYSAATVVCLAMAIQEATLNSKNIDLEATHRLHAAVLSLISLVCWVHKAKIFYEYVNNIIERRAQMAPHLNPPLRTIYRYAQHHVLWNKPELFFEDWEARYGLWKCFRSKKVITSTEK